MSVRVNNNQTISTLGKNQLVDRDHAKIAHGCLHTTYYILSTASEVDLYSAKTAITDVLISAKQELNRLKNYSDSNLYSHLDKFLADYLNNDNDYQKFTSNLYDLYEAYIDYARLQSISSESQADINAWNQIKSHYVSQLKDLPQLEKVITSMLYFDDSVSEELFYNKNNMADSTPRELSESKLEQTNKVTPEFEKLLDRDTAVEALRIALKKSGLSQRKFAEKYDIGLGGLTNILAGKASIDQTNLLLQKAGYGLKATLIRLPEPEQS